ncbi:MAG: hypothetical protein ACI4IF_02215 [Acutalibacteraceae bacterium]
MKRSFVIKANKIKLPKIDANNLILFTLLLCGVILGVSLVANLSQSNINSLETVLKSLIMQNQEGSAVYCFCYMFFIMIIFIVISYFCGLSVFGISVLYFLPVVFGFVFSCFIGLFYKLSGMKGLGVSTLIFIPYIAITTASLIKCCGESIAESFELFIYSINSTKYKSKNNLKSYTLKYLVLIIPVVLGAVLCTFSFKLFSGLFGF